MRPFPTQHRASAPIRDDAGVVLPSRVLLLAVVAVAIAAAGFVITKPQTSDLARTVASAPKVTSTPTRSSAPRATPTASPKAKAKPHKHKAVVQRSGVYVEVYNNSGIHGLAATTGARATDHGWNVVSTDNWYGTIPASTVYYPPRLASAAKLLGKDLGISRLKPAVAPMRFDRLTVILTADYH